MFLEKKFRLGKAMTVFLAAHSKKKLRPVMRAGLKKRWKSQLFNIDVHVEGNRLAQNIR